MDEEDRVEKLEVLAPIDKKIIAYLILFIAFVILLNVFITLYTEYLWFLSVNYVDVFMTTLYYQLLTFSIFFIVSFSILFLNNLAVRRATREFLGESINIPHLVDFVISIVFAYAMTSRWLQLLYFQNSTNFNVVDPIFKIDISFYIFKLPFIHSIISTIFVMLIVSMLISAIVYAFTFRWVKTFEELKELFPTNGYIHISALIFALFVAISAYLYFNRFELLTSPHGAVNGAGYTDVLIRIPALLLSSVLAVVVGALSFYLCVKRKIENVFVLVIIFMLIALTINILIPFGIQKFQVEPNELVLEKKYIEYSISFTRLAYGLDVKKVPYAAEENLSIQAIERNRGTIDNIRIWDHRPLLNVYKQIQQIRTYYVINDVDVDRYYLNKYTQIMISARELSTDLLPAKAKTWLNRHLIYTHGYGVVMSPVNAVSKEGLPELTVHDIPPKGQVNITRPEIYYGELTRNYAVVNTLQQEFDYPAGERNVFTYYNGTGGVPIGSIFKKILFSMKFGDVNLFLSNYVTEKSRIMFHREIRDRVSTIAPFLILDNDPYIAVIDGRLYWIVDAYTVLDKFPYSARYNFFNYIRNPVKVFVDAYNGTIEFYMIQDEPVIKTLAKAYPSLFKTNISEEKRKHIRYPIDLFSIQAEIYATYHMDDAETFYNREDVWEIPHEMYEDRTIEMEPYYVILSLEGEKPEFVLMLPFTPKGRDNIISWMAARCDERYGEIVLYEFPKGKLVYGPMQIEARIDQNSEISKLFTLWGQAGSKVIRGNLLVIPIENSVIYVEPVYLRAEKTQIPELRGVIVAYNELLTMKENLDKALEDVIGVKPKEEKEVEEKDVKSLVRESVNIYNRAIEEIKKGNWSGFGEMFSKLGEVLNQLNQSVK